MRFSARSTSHRYKGGLIMLSLDDRIRAAAAAPAYIYDGETVRNACARLKRDFPDVGFLYSVKTNPFAPVLREAAAQGFGADAASAGEVEKSLEAGFAPEDVYYSAPGKTDEDEKRRIVEVLSETGGNLAKTAQILGISRPTLNRRLKKYRLK